MMWKQPEAEKNEPSLRSSSMLPGFVFNGEQDDPKHKLVLSLAFAHCPKKDEKTGEIPTLTQSHRSNGPHMVLKLEG
jgi:hypothetical protein